MFTGIVQTKAKVNAIQDKEQFRHLILETEPKHLKDLEIGASIAINGCCLTVVDFESQGLVHFDVIDETLRLTNLGQLNPGDRVNFERSLTVGRELGGHIVSGHVHCTAEVTQRVDSANNCRMFLKVPPEWMEFILVKGFVAVDGASLTVGETTDEGFWLHLIPETLGVTTLGEAAPGSLLNIEADQQTMAIVATVKRVLAQQQAQ
ncbi:riboflavin synthase [Aliidiomarina minuta]|uniref:Riboflavin synthase n=1 Tax=Aliidiomarina minuta TaxID=880057 RepID=A0A432W680_9GAMM|nr:riboflavin synthase subunit alpha [Aliidiomarina minuta]RUO25584.1 riboflavin synthase [Aliidiomarina minuta]